MGAELEDSAAVEDQDQVGCLHGGEAVRDDDGDTASGGRGMTRCPRPALERLCSVTGSRAAAGSVESGVDRCAALDRAQMVAVEVADADRFADGELEAGVVLEQAEICRWLPRSQQISIHIKHICDDF